MVTRPTTQAIVARLPRSFVLGVVACTLILSLVLAAGASASKVGTLALSAKGLPRGQHALVQVNGHGHHQTVCFGAPRKLRLPAGHYAVVVRPVKAAASSHGVDAGAVAYPSRKSVAATIKAGSRTSLTVVYAGMVNPASRPLPSGTISFLGDPEDPGAVVLPGSGTQPAVGNIFVSGPTRQLPRGLISEVTAVKHRGPRVVASLVAVPVTDAVPSINYEGSIDLRPASEGSAAGADALARASSSCSSPTLLKFGAHLDSFELRQASIGTWPPQMNLTLAVRTTESLGLAVAVAGINCDWTLAELGPFDAAIPVGPIVVPVYATIPVKAAVHVNGTLGAATINVASTTVAGVAAGFDDNHVSLTQQGSNVWNSGVLSLSGSAKLSASIGVQAGIGVAKGANVHVSAGFGPEFEWSSGHACNVYADLGSLSAGVTVLGKSLNTPGWTPTRPRLWSGCASGPGGPGGGGSRGPGGSGAPGGKTPSAPITGASDQVALAGYHSCAVTSDGHVACWGTGSDGQLGDGSHGQETSPAEVLGIENAKAVTAGATRSGNDDYYRGFSCALLTTGQVKCWGDNEYSELGNGKSYLEESNSSIPQLVSGLTNAVEISASDGYASPGSRGGHVCALLAGGSVECWGANESGQLGDDSRTASSIPVLVRGLSNATDVISGGSGTCALRFDQSVWCWGQIPNRGIENTEAVAANINGITSMVGGDTDWCGSTAAGPIECWGGMQEAVPCSGTPDHYCGGSSTGGFYWPAGYEPESLAVSTSHMCAIVGAGNVECWGYNEWGQLGQVPFSWGISTSTPAPVAGLGPVKSIAVGYDESCAVSMSGQLYCWGRNNHGQLGNGTEVDTVTPVAVSPLP